MIMVAESFKQLLATKLAHAADNVRDELPVLFHPLSLTLPFETNTFSEDLLLFPADDYLAQDNYHSTSAIHQTGYFN